MLREFKSKVTLKEGIFVIVVTMVIVHFYMNSHQVIDGIRGLHSTLSPFISGFILAYILNTVATKIEMKLVKMPTKAARAISILIVYVTTIATITLLISYLIPILLINVHELLKNFPYHANHLESISNPLVRRLLQSLLTTINIQELGTYLTQSFPQISGYAFTLTSGIINTGLTLITSIYVITTKDNITDYTRKLTKAFLPPNHYNTITKYIQYFDETFHKFILSQLLSSIILGALAIVGLSLLRVNYAITLGTLLGVLNIIPFFGSLIALIIALAITFLTNSPMLATITAIYLLLLQQIDATIVTPKLMGTTMNLSPILVIIALTLGATYFGFLGILFAVPLAATLKATINNKIYNQ